MLWSSREGMMHLRRGLRPLRYQGAHGLPLRARLSVTRSAARGTVTRPRRESDLSPPAQAPESPYFPRFKAELGEMRENGPRQPPLRGFRV